MFATKLIACGFKLLHSDNDWSFALVALQRGSESRHLVIDEAFDVMLRALSSAKVVSSESLRTLDIRAEGEFVIDACFTQCEDNRISIARLADLMYTRTMTVGELEDALALHADVAVTSLDIGLINIDASTNERQADSKVYPTRNNESRCRQYSIAPGQNDQAMDKPLEQHHNALPKQLEWKHHRSEDKTEEVPQKSTNGSHRSEANGGCTASCRSEQIRQHEP